MKLDLNFASRRYVNRKAVNKGYWLVAILLIGLFFWSVMECIFISTQIEQNHVQLSVLQMDEKELFGTESIPLDSEKIETIRAELLSSQELLDQDSFRWTQLFDRMEKLLPPGVSIRRFSPNYEKRSLAIEGVAESLRSLQTLLDRLLQAEGMVNVYLKRHAEIKVKDSEGRERIALSFSVDLEEVF